MVEKALVMNAGDPNQVNSCKVKLDSKRRKEINDLIYVLSDIKGRRFLWRLMTVCKCFSSVFTGFENSRELRDYNAGQQDLGHFIMDEICSADQEYLFNMMKENKEEKEKNG